MRSKMRKQLAAKLTVEDSDMPVVWATTHQPLRLSDGWKRDQKMHDGCIYTHPKYGLGSLRGIEDDAGRKWMHFSLMPTCPITLEDVRDFRRAFFPDRAIVSHGPGLEGRHDPGGRRWVNCALTSLWLARLFAKNVRSVGPVQTG
jgi:hypothetical protein